MAAERTSPLNTAKIFIELLRQNGIDVSEAFVFGSAATGSFDKESDIDVAVVSRHFQGLPYYDVQKISKYRRKVDLRLEIHPFSFNEVQTDPPQFFMQIKNTGIRI